MAKHTEFLINGTPLVLEVDMLSLARDRHTSVRRRHCNDGYELILILSGSGQMDIEDDRRMLQAGQGVMIAPGRYHILQDQPGDFDRFCFQCHLPKSPLADAIRQQVPSHLFFDFPPEAGRLCRELFRLHAQMQPYWETLQYTLLKALLLLLFQQLGLGDEEQRLQKLRYSPTRLHQIDRYIEANLDSSATIEELARSMNLSRRQTMRVLQETCGMGFREKLLNARMDRAAWLLRTTDRPLDEIVGLAGYSSHSAFHQAFRSHFGNTSLRYRKLHRNAAEPQ